MAKEDWRSWGTRFKKHAYAKNHTLESLAETLGRNASSLRHWTNGNRQINLSEFFELCAAADVDPALILFGAPIIDEDTRARIDKALRGVFETGAVATAKHPKTSRGTRSKVRA